MSEQHDGGPAFPVSTSDPRIGHQDGNSTWQFPGLSVRDYFAAEAFAMLMHPDAKDYTPEETARQAYRFADAMLKERSK